MTRRERSTAMTFLDDLGLNLRDGVTLKGITELQLLQGPLSDIMTHVGQLALLRRLHGSPVPPENSSSRISRPNGWTNSNPRHAAPTRIGRRNRSSRKL